MCVCMLAFLLAEMTVTQGDTILKIQLQHSMAASHLTAIFLGILTNLDSVYTV